MRNRVIISIVAITFLSGCSGTLYLPPPRSKVFISGDRIVYDGVISGDAVLETIRIFRTSKNNITTLKITSPGGDMAAGIEFGYFIKEHNLDVEVIDLCFSSCANYILPAAKNVVINKNSLIGWHGGAMQSDELWKRSTPIKNYHAFMEYLKHLRIKETNFFDYVNVDQKITTYGQTIDNSCQVTSQSNGWYYSIEDLYKMGVKNITIKGSVLLNEMEYVDSGFAIDNVNHKGNKIKSCLLDNVFKS